MQYQGENYLIPVDAISRIEVPGHLRSCAIPLDYILPLMVEKGSDMNIVLLDACRSNPFKSIFFSTQKGLGTQKGLATLSRRADGMLISYATSPGEIASNGTGRYSPYTTRLVELMMIPDLPVEMMFNKLRSMVRSDTAGEQTPWIEASLGGFFYYKVKLSGFYMSKYAVTVAEFRKFVEATAYQTDAEKGDGSFVWNGKTWEKKAGINWRYRVSGSVRPAAEDNHPVLHVSWNDAVAYCEWMTKQTGKTCRLPTEAEREYACRAGSITQFNTGKNLTTDQANYNGNYPYAHNPKGLYRSNTVLVNSFTPNAWGLYNMHGNVWEWCSDLFGGR